MYILFLLFLLQFKHLLVDWVFQPPYEFMNKGTWLHWGGIRHSLKHALCSLIILSLFANIWLVLIAVVFEFVAHYLTDYTKVNINRYYKFDANKHPQFWWLTGLDQFVHQVCYLIIVAILVCL
jgi:hypothetical protein